MAFQMPPALAGDNDEISPDGEGAKNFAYVTGGLTAVAVAGTLAWSAKNRIMELAGADEASNVSLSVN